MDSDLFAGPFEQAFKIAVPWPCEIHGPDRTRERILALHADRTSRAPAPPQLEQQDLEPQHLRDVDQPHIETVTNDYSGETDTQQQRLESEAAAAREKFEETEQEASKKAAKGKSAAAKKAKGAKDSLSNAGHDFNENKDNPVVLGNMVVWTAIAGALGFGAYKQHQAGTLNWGVAGAWAGAVGLFATGDYFLSQYLFQKYPRK